MQNVEGQARLVRKSELVLPDFRRQIRFDAGREGAECA